MTSVVQGLALLLGNDHHLDPPGASGARAQALALFKACKGSLL